MDTLFGVTAVVLAPENPLVGKLITKENEEKVKKYIEEAKKKSDFERTEIGKRKNRRFHWLLLLKSGQRTKRCRFGWAITLWQLMAGEQ